ncbi:unnamed protein product [Sphagnum jensenii]|uniref:Uncharacterized protein n=1 Tax=Sphagnum jensenii TaxID=128206 RepID=A0ABP0V7T0_9BRYO
MSQLGRTIAAELVAVPVSLAINHAIDNKLAKAEKPGLLNRFMRWNLKVGRNPYYIGAVVGLNLGLAAYVDYCFKQQTEQRELERCLGVRL